MTPAHQTEEVEYDDAEHRYSLKQRIYRSATQIVEKFVNPFDEKKWSEIFSDRYGQPPEYWIAKWKGINQLALKRGDMIHEQKENFLYNRGFDHINDRRFEVYNLRSPLSNGFKQDYCKLTDGIYPELKLWRHDWGIAGRVDKPIIETINNTRFAHIDDYKTGKKISETSYRNWQTGEYQMMTGPLSHLMDCEYNHYALQLSIYQFMLEYFGFKAGSRRIIHYPHKQEWMDDEPKPVIIHVPYMRNEVLMMLNHLKNDGWLQ